MSGRARRAGLAAALAAEIVLLLFATMASGRPPAAQISIIGGSAASIGAYPWMAFIESEEADGSVRQCTGTVVAPRIVLTAGHCVEDTETGVIAPAAAYAVATGTADLNALQPANVSRVSQAIVYPAFNPSILKNDAGILVLAKPTAAPAIALAGNGDEARLRAGTPISIAGWGLTEPGAEEIPAELQAASTIIQSSTYCAKQVGKYYPFFSATTQLCAVDPPSFSVATCHGDSGGPAIAQRSPGVMVEIGITSLGDAKCSPQLPNVFTRVDQISSWVGSWIASVEGNGPTPPVTVPKLVPPKLTIPRARLLARKSLGEDFRSHYRRGFARRIGCSRVERERVRCDVGWSQGGNLYYGTITVYYLIDRETVYWDDRYKIHWVDDYCWSSSGHRENCVIHTRRR